MNQLALSEFLIAATLVNVESTGDNRDTLLKAADDLGIPFSQPMTKALEKLQKGDMSVSADTTNIKPESLEDEVVITTWRDSMEGINTGLKLVGTEGVKRLTHIFTTMGDYGHGGSDGFIGETGVPHTDRPNFGRHTVNLKIMAEGYKVGRVAQQENLLSVDGSRDLVRINRKAAMSRHSRKFNRALWYARTGAHRDGTSSPRFSGAFELIENYNVANSVLDLRGENLDLNTFRNWNLRKVRDFGHFNTLLAGPKTMRALEGDLAPTRYITDGVLDPKTYRPGHGVRSIVVANQEIRFCQELDFGHNTREAWKVYVPPGAAGTVFTGSHPNAPKSTASLSASASAASGGRVSLFGASDDGEYIYIVTEVVNGVEGLAHNANGTTVSVATGDQVALTITPSSALVESFKIYRTSAADADASYDGATGDGLYLMKEVASSPTGAPVVVYDLNADIPGSEDGVLMWCENTAWQKVFAQNNGSFALGAKDIADLPRMAPGERDSLGYVHLGESRLYTMELAKLQIVAANDALYGVGAPIIRNPYTFVRIKNAGRPGEN